MFLMGKRLHAHSITAPLGKTELPPPITEERCRELTVRLKIGDKSVCEEMILGHIRLGVYIAGLYTRFAPKKKRDLVSEAMLAIVEWTDKAPLSLKSDDYTRYIAFKIHRACGNFVYVDRLINIPISTRCLNKLKDLEIVPEQELPNRISTSTLNSMILKETLDKAIKNKRERNVIDLKSQGYTQQEVADILGVSQQWIQHIIGEVEERFIQGEKS